MMGSLKHMFLKQQATEDNLIIIHYQLKTKK